MVKPCVAGTCSSVTKSVTALAIVSDAPRPKQSTPTTPRAPRRPTIVCGLSIRCRTGKKSSAKHPEPHSMEVDEIHPRNLPGNPPPLTQTAGKNRSLIAEEAFSNQSLGDKEFANWSLLGEDGFENSSTLDSEDDCDNRSDEIFGRRRFGIVYRGSDKDSSFGSEGVGMEGVANRSAASEGILNRSAGQEGIVNRSVANEAILHRSAGNEGIPNKSVRSDGILNRSAASVNRSLQSHAFMTNNSFGSDDTANTNKRFDCQGINELGFGSAEITDSLGIPAITHMSLGNEAPNNNNNRSFAHEGITVRSLEAGSLDSQAATNKSLGSQSITNKRLGISEITNRILGTNTSLGNEALTNTSFGNDAITNRSLRASESAHRSLANADIARRSPANEQPTNRTPGAAGIEEIVSKTFGNASTVINRILGFGNQPLGGDPTRTWGDNTAASDNCANSSKSASLSERKPSGESPAADEAMELDERREQERARSYLVVYDFLYEKGSDSEDGEEADGSATPPPQAEPAIGSPIPAEPKKSFPFEPADTDFLKPYQNLIPGESDEIFLPPCGPRALPLPTPTPAPAAIPIPVPVPVPVNSDFSLANGHADNTPLGQGGEKSISDHISELRTSLRTNTSSNSNLRTTKKLGYSRAVQCLPLPDAYKDEEVIDVLPVGEQQQVLVALKRALLLYGLDCAGPMVKLREEPALVRPLAAGEGPVEIGVLPVWRRSREDGGRLEGAQLLVVCEDGAVRVLELSTLQTMAVARLEAEKFVSAVYCNSKFACFLRLRRSVTMHE